MALFPCKIGGSVKLNKAILLRVYNGTYITGTNSVSVEQGQNFGYYAIVQGANTITYGATIRKINGFKADGTIDQTVSTTSPIDVSAYDYVWMEIGNQTGSVQELTIS